MRKEYGIGYVSMPIEGTELNLINIIKKKISSDFDVNIIGLTLISDVELLSTDLTINDVPIKLIPINLGETVKYVISLENISLKNIKITKGCNIELYCYYA